MPYLTGGAGYKEALKEAKKEIQSLSDITKKYADILKDKGYEIEKSYGDVTGVKKKGEGQFKSLENIRAVIADFFQGFKSEALKGFATGGGIAGFESGGLAKKPSITTQPLSMAPTGKTGIAAFGGKLKKSITPFIKRSKKLFSDLGKSKGLKVLGKMVGRLGSRKLAKGAKKMGGMFAKMMGSSVQAMAVQKLVSALSPLMALVEPILSVLGGMLKNMMAEVIKPMMPHIISIMQSLLKLMPIFTTIGQIIGNLLAPALAIAAKLIGWLIGLFFGQSPGLIPAFQAIAEVIIKIIKIIFNSFLEPINKAIGLIETIAKVIGTTLKVAFESLEGILGFFIGPDGIITKLVNALGGVLITAFKAVAWVAYYVADAMIVAFNIIGEVVKDLSLGLISMGTYDRPSEPSFGSYAKGGIVTGPTIGLLGEAGPEIIIPLSGTGGGGGITNQTMEVGGGGSNFSEELERNNVLLREIIKINHRRERREKWR